LVRKKSCGTLEVKKVAASDVLPQLFLASKKTSKDAAQTLQPMSVPRARIKKLPFWAFSDPRHRFTYISVTSAQIDLECS
jgi:hypothetical protein